MRGFEIEKPMYQFNKKQKYSKLLVKQYNASNTYTYHIASTSNKLIFNFTVMKTTTIYQEDIKTFHQTTTNDVIPRNQSGLVDTAMTRYVIHLHCDAS